jgi:chemotaxis protein CheD
MKPHRFFDREYSCWVRRLLPGEFATSKEASSEVAKEKSSEGLMTVLGSCVAVCLTDPTAGVIGMNHFMLPQQLDLSLSGLSSTGPANRSARYGSYAMELLINELLSQGAKKDRFHAWIFGGAQILAEPTDVGLCNVQFAAHYLRQERIKLLGHDTGGALARRLYWAPQLVQPDCRLIEESLNRVQHRESRHAAALAQSGAALKPDISLFERA